MSEMSLSDVVLRPQEPEKKGRSALRKQERRRKRRRRRTLLAVVLSFVLVVAAVGIAWIGLAPLVDRLTEPDDYTGNGSGDVQVKIASGSTGATIGKVLADAHVVKTQKAFVDKVRVDTERAASIQPGTYRMHKQMSAAAAFALLLDPTARLKVSVTIPEGKRVGQTLDILSKQLGLKRADFDAAIKNPPSLGLSAGLAKTGVEGFLYPSTYDFEPGVTASEVLTAMIAQSEKALQAANVPAAKWREVITKASIVQAEAGRASDMPKVARVLDNRLAARTPLQLDSTVSYANNRFDVTTTPQERATTSRYTTYGYVGLPIGPIDSPGLEAIKAAVNPTPGPWLYFVTITRNSKNNKEK